MLDADLSFARARLDAPDGEDRIPGAVERVFAAGVAWDAERGVNGSVRLRHLGAYPLVEDNSAPSAATSLLRARFGYRLTSGLRLEAQLLNLLDSSASDIEYLYRSRLPHESPDGVLDIHFHAVEPRQLRLALHWGR